ncbi:Pkinase-domain-containing protein [Laetiporus sulphureus 93-53]|uniref:mitogen-activated protein kinase kinase kinase n=1 Tax=Laetiporus sulphureus 93-53 TaxID=1314785 RepID=A0A165FV69_9APHY|nr:Pkinase-domain-containing protein [Laetiporus sulphureus 93-53]KZT09454.1 Pkinase-domain-containing protein [Laetiporus sulphureus 93-53]
MTAVVANNGSLQPIDDQPASQASSPTSPTLSSYSQSRAPTTNGSVSGNANGFQVGAPALEPPLGMTFAEFLRVWSDAHVARWLADIKCAHHASTFREHDIRGDVLLELDQLTLKEMGIASVGDRLRILNAVKTLRQRCSSANVALTSIMNYPRASDHARTSSMNGDINSARAHSRRLESGRPAPLHLAPAGGSPDLPRIIRDGQDASRHHNGVRPLPQPGSSSSHSTPTTAHSVRPNLPPLPPPPRGQPPLPPNPRTPHTLLPSGLSGRRTPVQAEASPYSPLPFPTIQSGRSTPPNANPAHNRSGSYPAQPNPHIKLPPRPSTGTSSHPYAQSSQQNLLSPIEESSKSQRNVMPLTPSLQPAGASVRNSPASNTRPTTPSSHTPSLDDLKRKLVKFTLPGEGKSVTINVTDCAGGVEVLVRALKKFNKLTSRGDSEGAERVETEDGGLSVDGWGVYLHGQDGAPGSPLTEAQLLSICHAPPDDPSRENGLTLRKIDRTRRSPERTPSPGSFINQERDPEEDTLSSEGALASAQTKATKRASSISVLSGLGVPIPEKLAKLEASVSPPNLSAAQAASQKRPSKLRNFFGQRPPSELITTHLAEYFPNAEKKVLERTRRQSMMRAGGAPGKRDSSVSWNFPARSRFSVSTMGSNRGSSRLSVASTSTIFPERPASPPPPLPSAPGVLQTSTSSPPRLSVFTEDGQSVDLSGPENADGTDDTEKEKEPDESYKRLSSPHILPPVAFPSESLSESLNLDTDKLSSKRNSRTLSTSSRRMSYMTELRSRRDRSDTASLMTVDEITANVESRRESGLRSDSSESDEWTKVDAETDADKQSILEEEYTEDEDEEDEDEDEDYEEDDEEEDEETVVDHEEPGKTITSAGRERTIKWIKGALIGAGSFGKVYLGMDTSTGLLMAVKQVELPTGSAPNEERKKSMLSALEHEIELLRELQHENIVQYLSSCIDNDHLNIFLEYVPGGSVTSLLNSYGAFEEPLVRNWVRQILLGLNYLHERDIIHRDIKGANMLVDNKGGIKISDFGISKKVEDNLLHGHRAHRPSLQGSVFWMAPEVVRQTVYTQKADIWSVGCLVVEMLTGEHPWAQLNQMQAIFKIGSSAKPAIPADISPEAENFLQLTFDLDHEARPSAAELLKHPWIANQPMPLGR